MSTNKSEYIVKFKYYWFMSAYKQRKSVSVLISDASHSDENRINDIRVGYNFQTSNFSYNLNHRTHFLYYDDKNQIEEQKTLFEHDCRLIQIYLRNNKLEWYTHNSYVGITMYTLRIFAIMITISLLRFSKQRKLE